MENPIASFMENMSLLLILLNPFLIIIYLIDVVRKQSARRFIKVISRAGAVTITVLVMFALLGDAVFDRVGYVLPPREGTVVCRENRGHFHGVELRKTLDDNLSRVLLVVPLDLILGKGACYGDLAVELIRVRGPQARYAPARLCEHDGVRAVSMRYAADAGKLPIKGKMDRSIG